MKLEEPIRTERLVLREFVESDFDQVHEYGSDPEVVRFVPWGPNTPDATRAFIQRCLDSQLAENRKSYDLAAVVEDENRIIGGIGIRKIDSHGDTASFGYVFNRNYWGKGYATEAARAIIRFGFDTLKVHRIEAICDIENTGSFRVLEKSGMRREGMLRENLRLRDHFRNSYMYAIIRTD